MQNRVIIMFDEDPSGYIIVELPDGSLLSMSEILDNYCSWCGLDRSRISGRWANSVDSSKFIGGK